jgi:hypothetical protein
MVERDEIGRCAYDLHTEDDDFGQAGTLCLYGRCWTTPSATAW